MNLFWIVILSEGLLAKRSKTQSKDPYLLPILHTALVIPTNREATKEESAASVHVENV